MGLAWFHSKRLMLKAFLCMIQAAYNVGPIMVVLRQNEFLIKLATYLL